jgi:hypothetical protein
MGDTRSRVGILVGVAAGACAAAAMIAAGAAPTARADDLTDFITDLNDDYSGGPAAFEAAFTDFSSDQLAPGLAQLFGGIDDYTLGPANTLAIAAAEVLVGDPVNSTWDWGFLVPPSFAVAESVAQTYFTNAVTDLGLAANDFSTGDYVSGAVAELLGLDYSTIMPLQELLVGAAVSF